ncbi:MAG: hypothetical protein U0441_23305 [Polyangiaceae bacterium]
MGYSVMNSRSDFFLPASKKADALAALRTLFGRHALHSDSLEEALALSSFELTEDDEKNVDDLFLATNVFDPDDVEVLKAIAPFVRPGSYVMFIGEDADQWAWVFREHPNTHVVEAFEETVVPILESEYERLRRIAGLECARPSSVISASTQRTDDAECEGP